MAFFGALFAARTDVYAIRFDNQRTGKSGWVPAVRGGWQKGVRREDRSYLPLTPGVLAAHLKGEVHIGLYPLLDGDKCWWLAADFDGPEAMLDALMYVKAGRAPASPRRPGGLPVRGRRARVGVLHLPGPGRDGPRLGTGLLREAMALRGRMTLASYDRLFPSQDLLPAGGVGNLIAAPLFKPARQNGATVFLDLETLEPREDQWAYLSTLGRMTPQELRRAASSAGKVAVAAEVTRLTAPSSTKTRPPAPPVLSTRLATGIRLEQARRAQPSRKDQQHEADRGQAQRDAIRPRLRDRRRHHRHRRPRPSTRQRLGLHQGQRDRNGHRPGKLLYRAMQARHQGHLRRFKPEARPGRPALARHRLSFLSN